MPILPCTSAAWPTPPAPGAARPRIHEPREPQPVRATGPLTSPLGEPSQLSLPDARAELRRLAGLAWPTPGARNAAIVLVHAPITVLRPSGDPAR